RPARVGRGRVLHGRDAQLFRRRRDVLADESRGHVTLWRYLSRRLLFVLPQLIGITFVTFLLIQIIPGDPARLMLGPLASADTIQLLREHMGLNRPFPTQYGLYVWHA